jgi:hypothetical protein
VWDRICQEHAGKETSDVMVPFHTQILLNRSVFVDVGEAVESSSATVAAFSQKEIGGKILRFMKDVRQSNPRDCAVSPQSEMWHRED